MTSKTINLDTPLTIFAPEEAIDMIADKIIAQEKYSMSQKFKPNTSVKIRVPYKQLYDFVNSDNVNYTTAEVHYMMQTRFNVICNYFSDDVDGLNLVAIESEDFPIVLVPDNFLKEA